MKAKLQRSSGLLLHPTSLPGKYGIGSFNQNAYQWVDFLQSAGQSVWQILPLGVTGYGDSPYACCSSFAGNPYMISLEDLRDKGLVEAAELEDAPTFDDAKVNFEQVHQWKLPLLRKVAARSYASAPPDYEKFCRAQRGWLDDFALFRSLHEQYPEQAWNQWPKPLRRRQPEALAEARKELAEAIEVEKYLQWVFFDQWKSLKTYANKRGVQIFGDLPIFVALDSSDAWCNPDLFFFDKKMQPTVVAGVPPDMFSADGQLWGNPLYRWSAHKKTDYAWWIQRMRASLELYDIVRIDHFRGFAGYWEVKASAKTAREGRWVKGPGADLFKAFAKAVKSGIIVAEDLGVITPDVTALRDGFDLPGMKILEFAYGSGIENPFLPHNFTPNFVVYTGTHDNNTVRGWFENEASEADREFFLKYSASSENVPSRAMVRAAMQSVAVLAITPLQDLLDLGNEARMNFPGQVWDNWQWRLLPNQIKEEHLAFLKELTVLYGRAPSTKKEPA
jgi:4-alpha-glucanotransferase